MRRRGATFTIITLILSILLILVSLTLPRGAVKLIYVRHRELDEALCDVMAVNALAYYTKVKNRALLVEFMRKQVEYAQRTNPGFVVSYEIVSVKYVSILGKGYAGIDILWSASGRQYGSHVFLYVEVIENKTVYDPAYGRWVLNLTVECWTERGKPLSLKVVPRPFSIRYLKEKLWSIVMPAEIDSFIVMDHRGIMVEVRLR